jgi:hypothetical protein
MSDTPETDRLAEEFKRNTLPDDVKLDILFSYTRKLERECIRLEHERDRLRQLLVADSERVDAYLGVCTERDEAIARRMETIMQCELLKQDLAKAAEVLKHIEEQSRQNVTVVVGAPLREAICNCLNNIVDIVGPIN